jgi:hypothetical protein
MADRDWTLAFVIGLLVGIPMGVALFWAFTQFRGGANPTYQLSPKETYTNVEEWEILKDERGRTYGIRVHRRA